MPQNIRKNGDGEPLDRIDRALVALLQQNARLSNKQLAARVGLAESSTLVRVRQLEARGVLRGYHAEVAPWALGIELQAFIAVRLARHSRDVVERFLAHCNSLPEVLATFHIAGSDDFLVQVGVADTDMLRELLLRSISTRPEVTHVETHLIFGTARGAASFGGDAASDAPSAPPEGGRDPVVEPARARSRSRSRER